MLNLDYIKKKYLATLVFAILAGCWLPWGIGSYIANILAYEIIEGFNIGLIVAGFGIYILYKLYRNLGGW